MKKIHLINVFFISLLVTAQYEPRLLNVWKLITGMMTVIFLVYLSVILNDKSKIKWETFNKKTANISAFLYLLEVFVAAFLGFYFWTTVLIIKLAMFVSLIAKTKEVYDENREKMNEEAERILNDYMSNSKETV